MTKEEVIPDVSGTFEAKAESYIENQLEKMIKKAIKQTDVNVICDIKGDGMLLDVEVGGHKVDVDYDRKKNEVSFKYGDKEYTLPVKNILYMWDMIYNPDGTINYVGIAGIGGIILGAISVVGSIL